MIRSFLNVYTTPVGFDKQNLLTMRLNTARYYDEVEPRKALLTKVVENLGAIPGVRSAAVTTGMPAERSLTELPRAARRNPLPEPRDFGGGRPWSATTPNRSAHRCVPVVR